MLILLILDILKQMEVLGKGILLNLISVTIMTEQMFLKNKHKLVFEDFEKDIEFKNDRCVKKFPITKTDEILPDNYI